MNSPDGRVAARTLDGAPVDAPPWNSWQEIALSCKREVLGPDATSEAFWIRSLVESGRVGQPVFLSSPAPGPVNWVFAGTVSRGSGLVAGERTLRCVREAYSGRGGLLVRNGDGTHAADLLARLRQPGNGWDVVVLSVVEGSESHRALLDFQERGAMTRCIGKSESPYFSLGESIDVLLAALPKKMRWTMRKGEKDLRELGALEYREYTGADEVADFRSAIEQVERTSWKQEAGTSIARNEFQQRFYDTMLRHAAEGRRLSGHVLSLNSRPIAFILGILDDGGVFLDLKESFSEEFGVHSPGHVLKRYALARLIARGARTYDFMGACDPYKMRWTSTTYRQCTVAIYLKTPWGVGAYLRSRTGSRSEPIPSA